MRHFIAVVLWLLVLTSCATMIKSNVATFHDLPGRVMGVSYAVVPLNDQEGSLEYKTYVNLVRSEMKTQGFLETPFEYAELLVVLSYGVDNGQQVNYSIPLFGQTGVSSSYTYGSLQSYGGGYGTYSGTTTYTPTYGIVGSMPASKIIYNRFLQLDIVDKNHLIQQSGIKKVYEGRVTSQGRSGQLPEVIPIMIKSLFEYFPGISGKVRTSIRSMQ